MVGEVGLAFQSSKNLRKPNRSLYLARIIKSYIIYQFLEVLFILLGGREWGGLLAGPFLRVQYMVFLKNFVICR